VTAWDGNVTCDDFVAFSWEGEGEERRLVVVNYADHQSQCYVRLSFGCLGGRGWQLQDRLGGPSFDRDGNDLQSRGLYVDLGRWGFHVFDLTATE
jgi:hypothetical protein